MATPFLGLAQQADGAVNWDDAYEANWLRLDALLTLSGAGAPPATLEGTFVGQRYWDTTNLRTFVCVNIGTPATWALESSEPCGTMKNVLSIVGPPPGWLSMGQTVPQAIYPRLTAVLIGTACLATVSGVPSIILPNLTSVTGVFQVSSPNQIGQITGDNSAANGGGFTPAGTISAAGAHSHGGVTSTPTGISTQVGAVNEQSVASEGHTHTIETQGDHTHTFIGTLVASHTHTLNLRKVGAQVFIKAY